MNRCFALAKKGAGSVSPNPMVGCVIVYNDKIIGEGWHKAYGESHAEVNAINSVKSENKQFLSQASLYVNLEPCNHTGKTPPCAIAIIKHQIKQVVISNIDSNPNVDGSGIERLRKNGVEIITGILENEGRELNKRFFTSIEKNRPYIHLKWAETIDGFFAKNDGKQAWITNENSRRFVHKLRSEEDAILIGKNTLIIDQPKLNNRFFEIQKQPIRVVISREIPTLSILENYKGSQPIIIVNSTKENQENNMQYWQFEFDNNIIIKLLDRLYKQSIQSIIIEGGASTIQQFIDQNLWDEATILTGDMQFKKGIKSPKLNGMLNRKNFLDKDTISNYRNT